MMYKRSRLHLISAALLLWLQSVFILLADGPGNYKLTATDANGSLPLMTVISGKNINNYIAFCPSDTIAFQINPSLTLTGTATWNFGSGSPNTGSGNSPGSVTFSDTTTTGPIPITITSARLDANSLVCHTTQTVVTLIPVQITSVSFDGDKYWQLESDDASTQYVAPQWSGTKGDPTASQPGEHNYAVAYTCNTEPKIGATFKIPGASNWTNLQFKATGPDGINIPATAGTVGADGVTVTMPLTASTTALPNTVKFYNWADATSFTLNWSISIDGGTTWTPINTTKHSVYVTLVDPNVTDNFPPYEPLRQLTLFDTACRQATGLSDSGAIVNKVYSVFTHAVNGIPTVQRINPSTSQPDGPALTYWGPTASQPNLCWSTPGLLSTGDARCGGWAQFFHDALLVNGISSTVEIVNPPEDNVPGAPGPSLEAAAFSKLQNDITNFLPDKTLSNYHLIDIIFYVKNWDLSTSTTAPFSPVKPNGVAGQGGAGGAYPSGTYFDNHAIVEYGGKDYDPSYGSPIAPSRTIWENNALSGYGAIIEDTKTGVQYKWIWKPETQGTQDTTFVP